jgi:hypothetical protein
MSRQSKGVGLETLRKATESLTKEVDVRPKLEAGTAQIKPRSAELQAINWMRISNGAIIRPVPIQC